MPVEDAAIEDGLMMRYKDWMSGQVESTNMMEDEEEGGMFLVGLQTASEPDWLESRLKAATEHFKYMLKHARLEVEKLSSFRADGTGSGARHTSQEEEVRARKCMEGFHKVG